MASKLFIFLNGRTLRFNFLSSKIFPLEISVERKKKIEKFDSEKKNHLLLQMSLQKRDFKMIV